MFDVRFWAALAGLLLGSLSAARAQTRPAYLDLAASLQVVGSPAGKRLPLVVVLPATGNSAEEIFGSLRADLSLASYVALLPQGSPSTGDYLPAFSRFVGWYETRLMADIKDALAKQPIDPDRVFLVGFSLGGDLACALLGRHPDVFRGAFVMGSRCSSVPQKSALTTLQARDARVAFAIGESDDAARIAGITNAHQLVQQHGIATRFARFDGRHQLPPSAITREASALLWGAGPTASGVPQTPPPIAAAPIAAPNTALVADVPSVSSAPSPVAPPAPKFTETSSRPASTPAAPSDRPADADAPATLRFVGAAPMEQKLVLLVVMPAVNGRAEEIFEALRASIPLGDYALLLPQGLPRSSNTSRGYASYARAYGKRLVADIEQAIATQRVNPLTVYLVGYGAGGELACSTLSAHPDLFQGAVILSSRCSTVPTPSQRLKLQKRGARFAFAIGREDRARLNGITLAYKKLKGAKVTTQLWRFAGGHQFPDSAVLRDAFELLLGATQVR